jgi:hypothetical protein
VSFLTDRGKFRLDRRDAAALSVLLLVGGALRFWFWMWTDGLPGGAGTEEAFRLSLILRPWDSVFFHGVGPLQTVLGRVSLFLFSEVRYITRPLSLAFGLAGPLLVYLALRTDGFWVSFFGGLALAFSPAHTVFSTSGTAEAMMYTLVFGAIWCVDRAAAATDESDWRAARWWSIGAVVFLAAANWTRFETWILLPVLAPVVGLRLRRQAVVWLFALAAPLAWVLVMQAQTGDFFGVTRFLAVDAPDKVALEFHLFMRALFETTGPAVLLGALGSLVWLAVVSRTKLMAAVPAAVVAFFLVMVGLGRVPYDGKYVGNITVWMHLLAGVGVGLAFQQAAVIVRRFHPRVGRGRLGAAWTGAAVLLVFCLSSPALKTELGSRLTQEVGRFSHVRRILAHVEAKSELKSSLPTFLLVDLGACTYFQLYRHPRAQWRLVWPERLARPTATSQMEALLTRRGAPPTGSAAWLVVNRSESSIPRDDVPVDRVWFGYRASPAAESGPFRLYRLTAAE